jgi:hypothetical protein
MATFIDSNGTEWLVMEVADPPMRLVPAELVSHPEYRNGWLLFRSIWSTRRLAPYPKSWRALSDDELEQLSWRARPEVKARRLENSGEFRVWRG